MAQAATQVGIKENFSHPYFWILKRLKRERDRERKDKRSLEIK